MDTIFALSTGPSVAGVAVIRVSGPAAFSVAHHFSFALPKPRQAAVRRLLEPGSREVLDEALVLAFPAPHSFTGEDVVELQLHGSRAIVRNVLSRLAGLTAFRPADPGEFTRRAFVNGKMDLVDVEALGDVLAAETRNQARLARLNRQQLKQAQAAWREALLEVRGLTEALIDFSDEDDVVQTFDSNLQRLIATLRDEIAAAARPSKAAEIVKDGFRVVLLGPPNAGKSSLLNALAARDVAITSEIAGTTRDVLEVHLDLNGQAVILMDTAGLHETRDELEIAGIARTRRAAEEADLRLWLSPASLPASSAPDDIKVDLVVRTMSDLIDSDSKRESLTGSLLVSSKSGQGLAELVERLSEQAQLASWGGFESLSVVHQRQRAELNMAVDALDDALRRTMSELELKAEALRNASLALDRLIGRIDPEMVLDVIFSRFCIGK